MKWVTRRNLHVDRTACAWLVRRFVDPKADFAFVEPGTDPSAVDGHTFDMRDAEYTHVEGRCTFEEIVLRHGLESDAGLVEMGRVIREADVLPRRTRRREAAGLDALMRGFQLPTADDHEKLRLTASVYDALYAYCVEKVANETASGQTPRPRLRFSRRFESHVDEA
ncbi:MAG: chromate resistance protein [Dehalococcoidia bacterium]